MHRFRRPIRTALAAVLAAGAVSLSACDTLRGTVTVGEEPAADPAPEEPAK